MGRMQGAQFGAFFGPIPIFVDVSNRREDFVWARGYVANTL